MRSRLARIWATLAATGTFSACQVAGPMTDAVVGQQVPALEALYCRGQGLIVNLVLRRSLAASVVAGQRQAPPQLRYQRVAHAGGQHPL
jgi:hypothetical protein